MHQVQHGGSIKGSNHDRCGNYQSLIPMGGGEMTKRDMLVHWYQINLAETIVFQRDTNFFASEEDILHPIAARHVLL